MPEGFPDFRNWPGEVTFFCTGVSGLDVTTWSRLTNPNSKEQVSVLMWQVDVIQEDESVKTKLIFLEK